MQCLEKYGRENFGVQQIPSKETVDRNIRMSLHLNVYEECFLERIDLVLFEGNAFQNESLKDMLFRMML